MVKSVITSAARPVGVLGVSLILALSAVVTPAMQLIATAAPGDEHLIANCTQLQAIDDDVSKNVDTYKLSSNIDCAGVDFQPLFPDGDDFEGVFDGQGHTISGLSVLTDDYAGLFAVARGATFKNVIINGDVESTDQYAGGLVADAYGVTVENVISNVNVTSDSDAGGLIGDLSGRNDASYVKHAGATGNVRGNNSVGGLIGVAYAEDTETIIEQSFATGDVTGVDTQSNNSAGGLIGYAESFSNLADTMLLIQDTYATGNVSNENDSATGGLIGQTNTGLDDVSEAVLAIQRSYASGTVSAEDYVGGLIGFTRGSDGEVMLNDLFAAAVLQASSDPDYVGGILGWQGAATVTASNIFFDVQRANRADGQRCESETANMTGCTRINIAGANPGYFTGNNTSAPIDMWNFNEIWEVNSGSYPTLQFAPANNDGNSNGDHDSDGIDDAVENAAPNGGDGDNSGVLDSQEPNVTSFVSSVTGKYVTLSVSSECEVTAATMKNVSRNVNKDSGYSYPYGMMDFSISCGSPGYTATITQYYHDAQGGASYTVRKYNETNKSYMTMPGASTSVVTIGGKQVVKATYQITDGSVYDDDRKANGVIVDPAGIGVLAAGVPNTGLGGRR